MTSKPAALALVAAAALLSACSSGSVSTQPPAPTSLGTLQVSVATPASTNAAPTAGSSQGGLPGESAPPPDVDPCTLLTKDEASTLIGAKLGDGASTLVKDLRVCTWKSGLTEVKLFLAPEAPSAAVAQAYWDAAKADLVSDVAITDVAGFDRAAYGNGTSKGAPVSALFVIQRTWFFDLFCGFPACPVGSHVTAANAIVGRLP